MPACHWSYMAGSFKTNGKRSQPIAGGRQQRRQPVRRRSHFRKKPEEPQPPRPSNAWTYPTRCLNTLREVVSQRLSVSWLIFYRKSSGKGAFKELPTTPGIFWKIHSVYIEIFLFSCPVSVTSHSCKPIHQMKMFGFCPVWLISLLLIPLPRAISLPPSTNWTRAVSFS